MHCVIMQLYRIPIRESIPLALRIKELWSWPSILIKSISQLHVEENDNFWDAYTMWHHLSDIPPKVTIKSSFLVLSEGDPTRMRHLPRLGLSLREFIQKIWWGILCLPLLTNNRIDFEARLLYIREILPWLCPNPSFQWV